MAATIERPVVALGLAGAGAKAVRESGDQWALLAGLRFVLALVVVSYHANSFFGSSPWFFLRKFDATSAVVAFFLVSGFSIAASISRDRSQYFQRRVWRIVPVYWACAALSLVPFLLYGAGFRLPGGTYVEMPEPAAFVANLLCLQGIFTQAMPVFGQSWSLGCEVVYYICAPLLAKLSLKALLYASALSAALFIARPYFTNTPFHLGLHGSTTLCFAWAWVIGFAAYLFRNTRISQLVIIFAPTAIYSFCKDEPGQVPSITLIATGLLLAYGDRIKVAPKVAQVFVWLGDLSYPLYLSHQTVLYCVVLGGYRINAPELVGVFLVLATAVFYLVDYPCRRIARARLAGDRNERSKFSTSSLTAG